MKVNSYICNEKFVNEVEEITFNEIIGCLEECDSDKEVWLVGNINLPGTQLDILLIKEDCLIIIDMKNYTGEITGNENGAWKVLTEDGKSIKVKSGNCYEQANKQRWALVNKLEQIIQKGHLSKFKDDPGVFMFSKAWMYFNEGSHYDHEQISRKDLNWFKVVNKENLCENVKKADSSGKYVLTKNEFDELINFFNAEAFDLEKEYRRIIEDNWSKIDEIRMEDEFGLKGELNESFNEIISKTKDEDLKLICQHGLALTSESSEERFNKLLELYDDESIDYSDYIENDLLTDIFIEYTIWETKDLVPFEGLESVHNSLGNSLNELMKFQQANKLRELFLSCKKILPRWWRRSDDEDEKLIYEQVGDYLLEENPEDVEVIDGLIETYFFRGKNKEYSSGVKKLATHENNKEILDFISEHVSDYCFIDFPDDLFEEIIDAYKDANNIPSSRLNTLLGDFYIKKLRASCGHPHNFKDLKESEKDLWSRSEKAYLKAVEKRPGDVEALHKIALLYQDWGLPFKAKKYAERLLEKDELPRHSGFLILKIFKEISEETKDRTELYNVIKRLEEIYPGDESINHSIGKIYEEFKLKEKAIKHYKISFINKIKNNSIRNDFFLRSFGLPAFDSLIKLYLEKDDIKNAINLCFLLNEEAQGSEGYTAPIYSKIGNFLIDQYGDYDDTKEKEPKPVKNNQDEFQEKNDIPGYTLEDFAMPSELGKKIDFIIHRVQDKKIPNSMLLYGPPGCGKTHLARCIAGEMGVELIELDSSVLDMYVGNTEKNVQHLFDKLHEKKSGVLFIDEFEHFGLNRESHSNSWEFSLSGEMLRQIEKTVNMKDAGILIIAATNHKKLLDTAMIRKGRMNHHVEIPVPNKEIRKKIFEIKLNELADKEEENIEDNLDYDLFSEKTDGITGADIHHIIHGTIPRIIFERSDEEDLTLDNDVILESIKKVIDEEESSSKGGPSYYM